MPPHDFNMSEGLAGISLYCSSQLTGLYVDCIMLVVIMPQNLDKSIPLYAVVIYTTNLNKLINNAVDISESNVQLFHMSSMSIFYILINPPTCFKYILLF
jgi:hypothetical protein